METYPAKRLECDRRMILDPVLVTDDTERQVGIRALEAFELESSNETPSRQCLDALAAALRCSQVHVSITVAYLLGHLAGHHQSARNTIVQLQRDGDENTRFSAACAATSELLVQIGFTEEIFRTGLTDASQKVRRFVASEAIRLGIRGLVPDLRTAFERAADPKDKEDLDLWAGLLADGYHVRPAEDWEMDMLSFKVPMCCVHVRLDNGDVTRWFATPQEIESRGAALVAMEIASRYLEEEAERQAEFRRRYGKTELS
jgi:hypothetical protein